MANSPDVLLQQMAKSLEEIAKNSSEERKLRLLPQGDRPAAASRGGPGLLSSTGLVDAAKQLPGAGLAGQAIGAAGGALTAFAGAAGAAVSSISQLTGMVSSFVSAINPSLIQALGRAMHDLNASIGQAFTGAVEVAVEYVRELGSIINPLAKELQPIIRQLAETMKGMAVPYVQLFAEVMRSLAPVIQLFADGLKAIVPVVQAWFTVLQALVKTVADWIGSLFGNSVQNGMKTFADALRQLAIHTLVAVATMAKFFGAEGFLKNLESILQGGKRESAEGKGVGSNPQQQDFMSYARQSMLAALLAGSGGQKKQTEAEWRDEALKQLQLLQQGQATAVTTLADTIEKAVKKALGKSLGVSEGESLTTWAVSFWAKYLTVPGIVARFTGALPRR